METPISVKIVQTCEGPKFVTVFPMVAPRLEDRTFFQTLRHNSHNFIIPPAHFELLWGIGEYIATRADKEM